MPSFLRKLPAGPGLPLLLFVLGDIFMIKGQNAFSWLLIALGAAGAALYAKRNWTGLDKLPKKY
jgi:hypothetical protein